MARRDAYGKCPVKWFINELGEKKWICFAHLAPYTKHHERSEKCWYTTCPGRSIVGYPLTEEEINEKKAKKAEESIKRTEKKIHKVCANYNCNKKVAVGRKKYCSDKCRLQKARADYESRNPNRKRKANLKKKTS